MKYEYKSGRLVMPNGNKSDNLKCIECGEPQSHTFITSNDEPICFNCKQKDKEGLLE